MGSALRELILWFVVMPTRDGLIVQADGEQRTKIRHERGI